jgi:hypothetical protein
MICRGLGLSLSQHVLSANQRIRRIPEVCTRDKAKPHVPMFFSLERHLFDARSEGDSAGLRCVAMNAKIMNPSWLSLALIS